MDEDAKQFLPLPQAHFHVLAALSSGEKHGYAVMGEVERLSGGSVAMGPGTLYGTLKRLLHDGLIAETHAGSGGDQRRRYYRLTGLGLRVCEAEARRLARLSSTVVANLGHGLA